MNLFSYGVLQHPKILSALCGTDFEMQSARLDGYRKVFLNHEPFAPCAVVTPDENSSVAGQLLMNVDENLLPAFDAFECVGEGWYTRIECTVTTNDGKRCAAYLYAPGHAGESCLGEDWDQAYFLKSGRLDYLEKMLRSNYDPSSQQLID